MSVFSVCPPAHCLCGMFHIIYIKSNLPSEFISTLCIKCLNSAQHFLPAWECNCHILFMKAFIFSTSWIIASCWWQCNQKRMILPSKSFMILLLLHWYDVRIRNWLSILSWCWWNFLTSANQIAQIVSCDRSRIHVPDLGGTGVWPGKKWLS